MFVCVACFVQGWPKYNNYWHVFLHVLCNKQIDYVDVENELQEDATSDPMQHKLLTWYELDLGLNHVTRKNSLPVTYISLHKQK